MNNIEIKNLDQGMVEIKGEISVDEFEKNRENAIKKIGETLDVDGFRKGNVPANMVESKVGDVIILEEMAQMALSHAYPEILMEKKIQAIGQPQINITKLAKGNPLGFTITTAVMPEINLPDYKKIAKKESSLEDVEVTEKEIESVLNRVKEMKAKEEKKEVKDITINDQDVKKLGDFKDMEDFKIKMKENLKAEKEIQAKEKNRLKIIESIVDESKIDLPQILIDGELNKMVAKLKADVEQMGLKYGDYIQNLKKTEEEIRAEWSEDAKKRAKVQLVIHQIGQIENIKPDSKKVNDEVKKVTEAYKDADPVNARMYIENVFTNEEVFKFLESQN